MSDIRRKAVTLTMLGKYSIPSKLERIDFTSEIEANDLYWLKLGHVSEGSADLTSVYDTDEQSLYIFTSLFYEGTGMHSFICRIQFKETVKGATVLYVEADNEPQNKKRLLFLSPLYRSGFRVAIPDSETNNFEVDPQIFNRVMGNLIRYAQTSEKPSKRPSNISDISGTRIYTNINEKITEREFYHLMWGLNDELRDGRWFAYMENMTLYWHRSWTGECRFHINFKKIDEGYLGYEIVSSNIGSEPELGWELTEKLLMSRIYEYETTAE